MQTCSPHPYLSGNFAPTSSKLPLTPCDYTGKIPAEFWGGEYVRNGGNPFLDESGEGFDQDTHWFDGDGMLTGVHFRRTHEGTVIPHFVNAHILTDVYLYSRSSTHLKRRIIPSITTFITPGFTLPSILFSMLRALLLVLLSWLPGSSFTIKKMSVANTSITYHDGRALATCESGPPMRVQMPALETVGWFDGRVAEGEPQYQGVVNGETLGSSSHLLNFVKKWTTAHPRIDPVTKEMMLYHSTPLPPYLEYSIIPASSPSPNAPVIVNAPIPGVHSPKLMHDFAATRTHTIVLDLPIHLDPLQLANPFGLPPIRYDPSGQSRFGIFPRHEPQAVRWYHSTRGASCIFHTACGWDERTKDGTVVVNMIACRLNSAGLLFSAGNLETPPEAFNRDKNDRIEKEKCELTFYQFHPELSQVAHEFALSSIPFEFPTTHPFTAMGDTTSNMGARFVYGCSMRHGSFSSGLGRSAKIDCLVKIDVRMLVAAGLSTGTPNGGCVDDRTVEEILDKASSGDASPRHIQIFALPPGCYAQEPSFVPRRGAVTEDDGWLVTYVFDEETGLDRVTGRARDGAKSELWIIDARNMFEVVAKVQLPQRVPYGLHGRFFSEEEILSQRPVLSVRRPPSSSKACEGRRRGWIWLQDLVQRWLA